jgi:hypothetical protein
MKQSARLILILLCIFSYSQLKAQQKDYYYENQTRYGTFRHYVNGGSKMVTTFRGETDYAAGMRAGQQEAKRMTAEREKQRQIEFERMRKASGASQTSENRQPENDVRFETLKFSGDNTYTGKTLNGEPHGEGTVTFASDGRVMKGEFKFGQANGMMTITDKHYVQTGKFVNGKPVGDQRYEFDDGNTKLVEIRNMETGASTVQYPDRTSFSGTSDENGKYLKGKVVYTSGITFDGDYKNGRPYRGVWEKEGRIMIGEFGEVTPTELYLKFGYHYDPKTTDKTYGSFSPGMKRIGYSRTETSNNKVQHEIYGENETIMYVYAQFASGNILSVKAKQDGYDYVGTYYDATTNNLDPVIWDKKSGIKNIPANDPLAEKARAYSREVAPAVNAGKHEYEAKLKEVEPYIDAYNKNTGKSYKIAFDNWQTASQQYQWTVLEVPPTDQNVHRYLKDGVLNFKTNSTQYTWAFSGLDNAKPTSYTYEAEYKVEKELFKEGAVGIIIDIDEKNGTYPSKLHFMISPEFKSYYFGIYSFTTQWTSFLTSSDTGWSNSEAINGFTENGSATNTLKLEKDGDNISIYVNGKHLFTKKVSESGKLLGNFAGVGIVQKGMAKGQMSSIKFQMAGGQ